MAIFFIERAILIFANAIIEPFFSRIEQKNALSGYFYKRHPVDYKIFIFLGQPLIYSYYPGIVGQILSPHAQFRRFKDMLLGHGFIRAVKHIED